MPTSLKSLPKFGNIRAVYKHPIERTQMRINWLVYCGVLLVFLIGFQLAIGCDPLVALLCASSVVVCILPAYFYNFDLYGLLNVVLSVRYVFFALLAKTLYGQSMDEHSHYPVEAFFLTFCILLVESFLIYLVRRFDSGRSKISFADPFNRDFLNPQLSVHSWRTWHI